MFITANSLIFSKWFSMEPDNAKWKLTDKRTNCGRLWLLEISQAELSWQKIKSCLGHSAVLFLRLYSASPNYCTQPWVQIRKLPFNCKWQYHWRAVKPVSKKRWVYYKCLKTGPKQAAISGSECVLNLHSSYWTTGGDSTGKKKCVWREVNATVSLLLAWFMSSVNWDFYGLSR